MSRLCVHARVGAAYVMLPARHALCGVSKMWPSKILALFDAVDIATSDENELYGPFNALLDFCFPWEDGWNVVPQYRQPRDTIDFMTVFLVKRQKAPVFFLQVKPASHRQNLGTRTSADAEMRDRFSGLQELFPMPRLHAFSAMGNRLAHYKLICDNMELTPIEIPRNLRYVTDTAPADAWNIDVLTDDGIAQFMKVISDVKQMSLEMSV